MRFCKKCGAVLDEDSVFCANCGMKVAVSERALAETLPVSFNDKEPTADTAFKKTDSEISEPVYSTDIGFFRYNFEKESLEFINHQTKMVAEAWNIPRDQWEGLPSQAEYCENIVDQENRTVIEVQKRENKIKRATALIVIETLVFLFIAFLFSDYFGYMGGLGLFIYIAMIIIVEGITWSLVYKTAMKK